MTTDLLDLADYRRRVGDLYRLPTLEDWREGRDRLFREHPQSAIEDRDAFTGLAYFPPDSAFRVRARLLPHDHGGELVIDTGGEDGAIR